MKCYLDKDGYIISLTPVEGGIEVDAPDLKFPTSQHKLVNGEWTVSDVTPERVLQEVAAMATQRADTAARKLRSEKLADSDWTQLPDVPLDTKSAWATYRQALRDITQQPGYPTQIDWPVEPT